jgi:MFS family permease
MGLGKYAAASVIGTTIEYYDFIAAGLAAALVWPTVFYPQVPPALGLLYSILSFALGIAVRPIGALIFGHIGDKYGRKTVLVWTLVTMGIGTFAIGVTPSYAMLGIVGGLLVFVFRVVQGIGIGGEWGGAAVWVCEHAKESKRRALWTNWVSLGIPFGLLLSSGSFLILVTAMPRSEMVDWGWRIPFAVGVVIVLVGLVIRYKLLESPLFRQVVERKETAKQPALQMLKEAWAKVIILGIVWNYIISLFYVATTFNIGYMSRIGITPSVAFLANVIAAVSIIVFQTMGAILGDKIGRKKVVLIGAVLSLLMVFPYYMLLNTKVFTNVILGQCLFLGFVMVGHGVIAAFFPENFPTKYRNSGAGLSYQLGAPLSAITASLAPYFLVLYGDNGWYYVSGMVVMLCVASLIMLTFTKETIKTGVTY